MRYLLSLSLLWPMFVLATEAAEPRCAGYQAGHYQLYWGDLHVHSAFSLDAYAFGTLADPGDAFAFARGQELTLPDRRTRIKLRKPLDFAAVTDHAETFDMMYLCTDPAYLDTPYCEEVRANSGTDSKKSLSVFAGKLLPLISGSKPTQSPLCDKEGVDCEAASQSQWQRVQRYANQANESCHFSAFIANEWSATPKAQHWHRNLIFASESVSREAIDYIRYPSPQRMWAELDRQCKAEDGCEVIAIPHNTNLSEGGGFDVETDSAADNALRARYERLMEVYQSKGSSECLREDWRDRSSDCGFEQVILPAAQQRLKEVPGYLKKMQRSYARNMLGRGLLQYGKANAQDVNPLQLGFIGSTDNHVATPGAVDEANWKGDAWGGGDAFKLRRLQRRDYNPGGLIAVWAEENTRRSLFDAMKQRRVYASSGPRIQLRFQALYLPAEGAPDSLCDAAADRSQAIPMGGSLPAVTNSGRPAFVVMAAQDETPLAQIEIIKGTVRNGTIVESRVQLMREEQGLAHSCRSWLDADFDAAQPSYWYARVLETPTPRWSKTLCDELAVCQGHPELDVMIQERAWSSPIWYLPAAGESTALIHRK